MTRPFLVLRSGNLVMEITSAFQGITTPLKDLYTEIHARGWEVINVDTSDGSYVAQARNPHGDTVEKTGRDAATALANVLTHIVRKEFIRQGAWTNHWADQLEPIAQAYARAPAYDPAAAGAWIELANDCAARAQQLQQQLQVEITDDPVPYSSPQEMWKDVEKNKRLMVSRAGANQHPIWTEDQVINYRLVHDVLGHAAAGGDFGWTGENLATAAHMPYLSPSAQQALFTEAIGNSAYQNYHRGWGVPKIVFLNEHLKAVQDDQNPPGHGGEPVGATLSPGPVPERRREAANGLPSVVEGGMPNFPGAQNRQYRRPLIYHAPTNTIYLGPQGGAHQDIHEGFADTIGQEHQFHSPDYTYGEWVNHEQQQFGQGQGFVNRMMGDHPVDRWMEKIYNLEPGQDEGFDELWEPHQTDSQAQDIYHRLMTSGVKRDPNYGYETGVIPPAINAVTAYGDPLDSAGTREMAHALNTDWHKFVGPDGQPDFGRMKIAVMNAMRAAILSPRKELRWNAVHYQDLSHIPHDHADPKTYWDALEQARIDHNRREGIPNPEISHKAHYEALLDFYRYYAKHHPEFSPSEVKEHADREVQIMQAEIEEKLWHETKDPEMQVLEPKVFKQLDKRLKAIVKDDRGPFLYTSAETSLAPQRYGAFIGRHAMAIAKVSRYADVLTEAALEDMRQGGSGHVWRQTVLSLQLPYVGPKIASFAWLLLAPLTSQIATVDSHIAEVLGHDPKKTNDRDYFRMERELQAGRDASGYGHLPLGQFQWAIWDGKRTGWGSHQDHSPLRPWEPVRHHSIEWPPSVGITNQNKTLFEPPEWWAMTEPYRQNEAAKWNVDIAPYYTQKSIPWANHEAEVPMQKTADWQPPEIYEVEAGRVEENQGRWLEGRRPFLYHPESNGIYVGEPGSHHGGLHRATGVPYGAYEGMLHTQDAGEYEGYGPVKWWSGPKDNAEREAIEHQLKNHFPFTQWDQEGPGIDENLDDLWTARTAAKVTQHPSGLSIIELDTAEHRPAREGVGNKFHEERRPFVYHKDDNEVIVGDPGTFHSQIDPNRQGAKGAIFDENWMDGEGARAFDVIPPHVMDAVGEHFGVTPRGADEGLSSIFSRKAPNIVELDTATGTQGQYGWFDIRRPFIYHPESNTIYMGNANSHHPDVHKAVSEAFPEHYGVGVPYPNYQGMIHNTAEVKDYNDYMGPVHWWQQPKDSDLVEETLRNHYPEINWDGGGVANYAVNEDNFDFDELWADENQGMPGLNG